jgi:hypothetical protein
MTRDEAKLLLAGIRVLSHRLERAPTPEELAELLDLGASPVRLHLTQLVDLGAVAMVESAFENHVEVRDEAVVAELPEAAGPAISEDLKAFDERKREESDRMSRLFESGDQDEKQQERHRRMDDDLRDFKGRKPRNPFGDD